LRNERYPDDIRTFLLDPEMRPEAVWVRLERQLAENEFECTLLNEPEQDFGVHLYDRVVVIVKRAEYRTMSICIGLLSNLSKNIGRIFSDFSEYSKEFF
jgi:hypothetical protein